MDIIVGIIFWGGLLVLVLGWLTRSADGGPSHGASGSDRTWTTRSAAPTPPGPAVPATEARQRETDALTDGLVIGHFLTRDHERRRLDELEGQLEAAGWASHRGEPAEDDAGFDAGLSLGADLDADLDLAGFDALGGFGVEPWADDLIDDLDDG